jgi:hypothetical protein
MDLHVAECSDDPGQSLAMKKASGADLSAPLEAEASSAVQEDGSLHLADSPQEESSAAKNQDCGLHLARPELTDYGKYSSAEKQDCCLEMKLPELPAVFENSAVDACLAIDNVVDGFEQTPSALHDMLAGKYTGKVMVRYGDAAE